jgi:hypothetical protein
MPFFLTLHNVENTRANDKRVLVLKEDFQELIKAVVTRMRQISKH